MHKVLTKSLWIRPLLRSLRTVETAGGTVATLKPQSTYGLLGHQPSGPLFYERADEIKPVDLAFKEFRGKGQEGKTPLIIHHSLYGRKENWNPISEVINRTTERKIINVDARNHGASPRTKDMSLPLMTRDVLHLIENDKYDKVSFMGHSLGGRIGINLALMKPKLIDKLIVVDASVVTTNTSRQRWSQLRQACYSLVKIENQLKDAQGYERLSLANKAIENIIVEKTERASFLSNLILSSAKSSMGNDHRGPSPLWRLNMSAYLSHPDMMSYQVERYSKTPFEGSTLFISGEKSHFISRDHQTAIRKVFPNAQFEWLKDCGHRLHLDHEKEFCEKVISFMKQK